MLSSGVNTPRPKVSHLCSSILHYTHFSLPISVRCVLETFEVARSLMLSFRVFDCGNSILFDNFSQSRHGQRRAHVRDDLILAWGTLVGI